MSYLKNDGKSELEQFKSHMLHFFKDKELLSHLIAASKWSVSVLKKDSFFPSIIKKMLAKETEMLALLKKADKLNNELDKLQQAFNKKMAASNSEEIDESYGEID